MQNQRNDREGMENYNAVLTISNYALMEQLEQLTTSMGTMKAQIKTLSSSETTIKNGNNTVGSAGATSPMGERHVRTRSPDTKMRPIVNKELGEVKRGANYG